MARVLRFGEDSIEVSSYYRRCWNGPQQLWEVDVEEAFSLLLLFSSGRGANIYQQLEPALFV